MNAMRSSAVATRVAARPSLRVAPVSRKATVKVCAGKAFPSDWVRTDPFVLGVSFLGWTIPSNIGTSAFNGDSLFGLLNASIADNLAHFPTGPALDDKFWLYLFTWHIGLFVTMTLGQIGVQGRKQGYW